VPLPALAMLRRSCRLVPEAMKRPQAYQNRYENYSTEPMRLRIFGLNNVVIFEHVVPAHEFIEVDDRTSVRFTWTRVK